MNNIKPLVFTEIDHLDYEAVTPFCKYDVYLNNNGKWQSRSYINGVWDKLTDRTNALSRSETMDLCFTHYQNMMHECLIKPFNKTTRKL